MHYALFVLTNLMQTDPNKHQGSTQTGDEVEGLLLAARALPPVQARACLEEAEREAARFIKESGSRLLCIPCEEIARSWIDLFGDAERARRCLDSFRKPNETASDLVSLARSIHRVLGQTWACEIRGLLLQAEEFAGTCSEWAGCSEAWRDLLNETERAQYCLGFAENHAITISDHHHCACSCRGLFEQGETAGRRCLYARKAEGLAVDIHDWRTVASVWHLARNDEGQRNTRYCLLHAEEFAATTVDWTDCAEEWDAFLAGEASADVVRCMDRAEGLAKSSVDWLHIVSTWFRLSMHLRFPGDTLTPDFRIRYAERYERAVGIFEKRYTAFADWIELAIHMLVLYRDEAQFERFMLRAEGMARTPDDWRKCGAVWAISQRRSHVENALICRDRGHNSTSVL